MTQSSHDRHETVTRARHTLNMTNIRDTAHAVALARRAVTAHREAITALSAGGSSEERQRLMPAAIKHRDRAQELAFWLRQAATYEPDGGSALVAAADEVEVAVRAQRSPLDAYDLGGKVYLACLEEESARLRAEHRAEQPLPGSYEHELAMLRASRS